MSEYISPRPSRRLKTIAPGQAGDAKPQEQHPAAAPQATTERHQPPKRPQPRLPRIRLRTDRQQRRLELDHQREVRTRRDHPEPLLRRHREVHSATPACGRRRPRAGAEEEKQEVEETGHRRRHADHEDQAAAREGVHRHLPEVQAVV